MEGLPTPLSRVELYLAKAAGMDVTPPEPKSRLELFLAKIAGMDVEMPAPLSLKEMWLAHVAGSAPIEPLAIEGAFYIDNQKVDVRYLAVAAGVIGATLPEKPQNRKEQYWLAIAGGAPIVGVLKYVTGTNITLTDVVSGIEELQFVYGDTYQQTYSGANLYNYADTTGTIGSGITTDSDGWITCTYDNSAGTSTHYSNYYTTPLALTSSTNYALVLEIRSVSGTGSIEGGGGNTASQVEYFKVDFTNMTTGNTIVVPITSKSDVSGLNGLRSYFRFNAGQSGSVSLRISVLADTSVTPETFVYQPFTGNIPAPNPDYPQPIQVATGEQTVEVHGKNWVGFEVPFINAYFEGSGSQILASVANRIYYVPCRKDTTYTITTPATGAGTVFGGGCRVGVTNELPAIGVTVPTVVKYGTSMAQPSTYTTTAENAYFVVRIQAQTGSGLNLDQTAKAFFDACQIEIGSTATAYQPYQSQSYDINLVGKNLWGGLPSDVNLTGSIAWVNKADGTITANGTASSTSQSMYSSSAVSNNHTIILQAGTYTLSGGISDAVKLELVKSDGTTLGTCTATPKVITLSAETTVFVRGIITSGTTVSDITLKPQLELGPTATSYAPYYNYELCKIGNYQDYIYKSGDDWYVHKATTKTTLDGSETWYYQAIGGTPAYYRSFKNVGQQTTNGALVASNYFLPTTSWTEKKVGIWYDQNIIIKTTESLSGVGDVNTFKTWLNTHNVLVRLCLATPTDTKITDATLVGQLNAIDSAVLPKPVAYITVGATDPNLPAPIKISYYGESE